MDKFDQVIEELEGCQNMRIGQSTYLCQVLTDIYGSMSVLTPEFSAELDKHLYVCEHCDKWIRLDSGYNWSNDGEQICNECAEYEDADGYY